MSECLKTGCHVYLAEYGIWARGDAFTFDVQAGIVNERLIPVYFFRFTHVSPKPIEVVQHFTIHEIEHEFDINKGPHQPWTVIAKRTVYHGYDGVAINGST
jgi:hypothetical protein